MPLADLASSGGVFTAGGVPKLNPLLTIGFATVLDLSSSFSVSPTTFGTPKANPEVTGFSSVADVVPNEKLAFTSSEGLAPNWNFGVFSLSFGVGVPKLNPPFESVESEFVFLPKLKPFAFDNGASPALSIPNLKPLELVCWSNFICELVLEETLPGFGVSQAAHLLTSGLFEIRQVSHVHEPSGFLNKSPKPVDAFTDADAATEPGLTVSHATHLVISGLFWTMQLSHVHVPAGFLNISPNPEFVLVAVDGVSRFGVTFKLPGLAVLQHGQVTTDSAFRTIQQGHSQVGLDTFATGDDVAVSFLVGVKIGVDGFCNSLDIEFTSEDFAIKGEFVNVLKLGRGFAVDFVGGPDCFCFSGAGSQSENSLKLLLMSLFYYFWEI